MKNRLTYLISSALGLLFFFMFGEETWFDPLISGAIGLITPFCAVSYLAVLFLTLCAAVASFSARRDIGMKVLLVSIAWGLAASAVLCLLSGPVFGLFSQKLSVSQSVSIPEIINPFTIVLCSALVLGFALRPTSSIFKEAYGLSNSLSEVAFRFCTDISRIWWIPLFFFSAGYAGSEAWLPCAVFAAIAVFAVLPLLFCIFTGFRHNPYRKLYRLIPPAVSAFFSGSADASYIPLYCTCRNNLGVQKRVVSLVLPVCRISGCCASATLILLSISKDLVVFVPFAALMDVLIAGLGTAVCGKILKADCEICAEDEI